jgi:hypothetical protein
LFINYQLFFTLGVHKVGGTIKAEVPASVFTLLSQKRREKDRLEEYVFTLHQLPHSIQVAPVLTWSFVDEVKETEC